MHINMPRQPDDETCGPTSLHAIYEYYDDDISLEQVITEVERVKNGGTLTALLGKHALQRGYNAEIYTYNLDAFDPSWFHPKPFDNAALIDKLQQQLRYKRTAPFQELSQAYIDFMELGGQLRYHDLSATLLKHFFVADRPILAGLSATYLYQSQRERVGRKGEMIYDDLRGEPCGHFVVLCGYDETKRHVVVADPLHENPISRDAYYKVHSMRLINAIMLGVLTYDGTLLIVHPKE